MQGPRTDPSLWAGGFVGSLVPMAAWLNPHSTTGLAVQVSKFFNIQFRGSSSRQQLISRNVAMGMSVEDGVLPGAGHGLKQCLREKECGPLPLPHSMLRIHWLR